MKINIICGYLLFLLLLFLRGLNIKDPYLFNAFFQLLFTTRILLMRAARISSYDCMKKWKISKLILSTNIIFFVWSIFLFAVRLILCQCQTWCDKLALPWAGVGPDDLCCSMVLLLFKIISVIEEIAHAYLKMLLWTKFYRVLWLCSAIKTVESH